MSANQVPVFQQYMNPILAALRALGGSARIEALDGKVSEEMGLSPEVLAIRHKADQPGTEVSYRVAWARTYLKFAGLLTNPSRGTWALTEQGVVTTRVDEYALASRYATRAKADPGEATESAAADSGTTSPIAPALQVDLRAVHEALLSRGGVLRTEQALGFYRRFRARFGPDVLGALDGQDLLATMHGRQTKDSLVYWLEFKDDDEFPGRFGSIAGGSALKFGMYQSKEGDWWTGTPQRQMPLSLAEACERARQQRDELVRGASVLDAFTESRSDDYAALQSKMLEAAPELAETAWGHKYFSLLHPYVLDDYHALNYQQYHLIKLLQIPRDGRYANAGAFVGIARGLTLLPNQLAAVLNHRNSSPHEYWRVGTTTGVGNVSEWPRMCDGGFMAIGWTELGDLSTTAPTKEGKAGLRALMETAFPTAANVTTRKTQELFNFVVNVHERDLVLAMDGGTVKGIGIVRGPYRFQAGDGPFGHRRRVDWLDTAEWQLPEAEGLRTTFVPLGRHKRNLVAIEARLLGLARNRSEAAVPPAVNALPVLVGVPARVQAALERKRQVILFGPPGTGKTHWAQLIISELVARSWFGKEAGDLSAGERETIDRERGVSTCTFHPAYGYEDFIEGYRPAPVEAGLGFRLSPGLFKETCDRARAAPDRQYFVLIDEINRGDIPRIFGELLTLLEKDKRGRELLLPLSGEKFSVPENVFLVGTMNTADRSIALLDSALRRRFAFVELLPDAAVLGNAVVAQLPLGPWLRELNDRIVKHIGRDARSLQVGHAYLMQGSAPITDPARFLEVFRDDLLPLLEEYCYDDFEALASILGAPLVSRDGPVGLPRVTAFEGGQELINALLQSFDGLATAPEAIAAEEDSETKVEEPDDESDEVSGS
jgi:5-methylcytosine-specific restriction enzyme B